MSAIEWVRTEGFTFEPLMANVERVRIVGLIGCLAVTAAFWYLVGPIGIVLGLGVLVCWLGLGTPFAIAVGHVFLAPFVPETLAAVVLVEVGFVVLVLAPVIGGPRVGWGVARIVLVLALLAALLWSSLPVVPLWLTVAILLGTLAVGTYGLHRLALLRLGKIEGVDA